jgi:hypothetical protein
LSGVLCQGRKRRRREMTKLDAMTPRQKELARHALGLKEGTRRSYRNHFVAGPGHEDYEEWRAMISAGLAVQARGTPISGGMDVFWLTRRGAEAALDPGEKLDPVDDFPEVET